jgi:hypothetical protein
MNNTTDTTNTAVGSPSTTAPTAPTVAAPSIASSAMLVELNISTWTGRKLDRQVSAEIDVAKHTTTRAGNYNKKLFADEPTFDAIGKFAGMARTAHYHSTMPWSDSGLRLLTTAMYFDYQKKVSQMEMDFNNLVSDFINQYDKLCIQAQMKLGTLFNAEDYPDRDTIASRFRFSVKYSPVPEVGDFRVDVGNDAQQQLKESYARFYQENLESAYKDVWTRTHDALTRMSEKLAGQNKQIFRDTLVTNVREMVDLLDKFNVTDDTNMRRARAKLEDVMMGITPEALREDDHLRHDTKSKVDALLKEFSW